MKLRNKTTGEIVNFIGMCVEDGRYELTVRLSENDKIFKFYYYSIEELSKKWEDYEEPKEVWYIDFQGVVRSAAKEKNNWFKENEIGNYFETKAEAEKAVEKLKAWKRLKENGFKFEGIKEDYIGSSESFMRKGERYLHFNKSEDDDWLKENWKDLNLLFGNEK